MARIVLKQYLGPLQVKVSVCWQAFRLGRIIWECTRTTSAMGQFTKMVLPHFLRTNMHGLFFDIYGWWVEWGARGWSLSLRLR